MPSRSTRRPRWVYEVGDDPDPRFSLANERTFLAWVRTALAIAAGAVAMHSFGVPETGWLRVAFLLLLIVLALTCTVLAWIRWAQVERAMRHRQPLPSAIGAIVVGIGTVTLCLLAGLALVV